MHVVLAGAWFGGVIFTTTVVTPALKTMKWAETEHVLVRSVIGGRYARVRNTNLVLLLIFALLDGWSAGFGTAFYAEYALLVVLFSLVALHGTYLGRRLVRLAEAEKRAGDVEAARNYAERHRTLQRVS